MRINSMLGDAVIIAICLVALGMTIATGVVYYACQGPSDARAPHEDAGAPNAA